MRSIFLFIRIPLSLVGCDNCCILFACFAGSIAGGAAGGAAGAAAAAAAPVAPSKGLLDDSDEDD